MYTINWLLESEPYVQYAVRKNILRRNKYELSVLKAAVLSDARIEKYLSDIANFNAMPVANHKNPETPIHKLLFMLDIGLDTDILQIDAAIHQILRN